jgi:hypothetical protein
MDTMKNSKTVKFHNWTCRLQFGKYINGRTAIQLYDSTDGDLVATATVNVEDLEHLGEDEVIIKNYSENEGILDVLVDAEIISKPLYQVQTGFVQCLICKLLVNPDDYEN